MEIGCFMVGKFIIPINMNILREICFYKTEKYFKYLLIGLAGAGVGTSMANTYSASMGEPVNREGEIAFDSAAQRGAIIRYRPISCATTQCSSTANF